MNCLPLEANWLAEVNSLAQPKAQHLVRQRRQSSRVLNSLLTTILVCSSLSISPESCPGKLQHALYAQKRGNQVQPERPSMQARLRRKVRVTNSTQSAVSYNDPDERLSFTLAK